MINTVQITTADKTVTFMRNNGVDEIKLLETYINTKSETVMENVETIIVSVPLEKLNKAHRASLTDEEFETKKHVYLEKYNMLQMLKNLNGMSGSAIIEHADNSIQIITIQEIGKYLSNTSSTV